MRAEFRLILLGLVLVPFARAEDAALIHRGREVYIAEGCIHCHSQYVRPGTADEERWGPAIPLSESERQRPPLFGNRRQGPDLQNVGARRTAEWQRLHLQSPRAVTPGSRMPSYAHLFSPGPASDGEALLAYLGSLGMAAPSPDPAGAGR
jgi:cytochrome c oxidase cbb3-type subunit 2